MSFKNFNLLFHFADFSSIHIADFLIYIACFLSFFRSTQLISSFFCHFVFCLRSLFIFTSKHLRMSSGLFLSLVSLSAVIEKLWPCWGMLLSCVLMPAFLCYLCVCWFGHLFMLHVRVFLTCRLHLWVQFPMLLREERGTCCRSSNSKPYKIQK